MNNEIGIYKRLAIMDTGENVNKKIKELAGTDTSIDENAYNVRDENIKHIVRARELPSNITLKDSNKISIPDSVVPIYAWFDNGILYYYTEADTIYLNEDSGRLFTNLSKVEDIDMNIFDTSNVTSMRSMFYCCKSLTELNLDNFNTSNVTNMTATFGNMLQLEDINALENWNVSKVTDLSSFLSDCRSLIDFSPLSKWDTSKVTMQAMFQNYNIKSFEPFENWDVSKVENFSNMFNQTPYSQVKTLHGLEKWDVSSAKKYFRYVL